MENFKQIKLREPPLDEILTLNKRGRVGSLLLQL